MKKELVLALWDRDFSWIDNIDSSVKITKYNKNPSTFKEEDEIFLSPNVGRDVHTFFWHIVNNYDNMADYTFFAQDYVDDHVMNYTEIINGDVENIGKYAMQDLEGCWFFNTHWAAPIEIINGNCIYHGGLPLSQIWEMIFETKLPERIEFTAAGHFCITREHVHQYPVERYKRVLDILEKYEIAPWCIERFEAYIFEKKK